MVENLLVSILVLKAAVAHIAEVGGVEDDVGVGADQEAVHVISICSDVSVMVEVEDPARLPGSFEDHGIGGWG